MVQGFAGMPHDLLTGRHEGHPHRQYLREQDYTIGMETFVHATKWFDVRPNVPNDMTAQLAAAFAGTPAGRTLYIPPGLYHVSASLLCSIPINIWAYGAIFDFGTTDLSLSAGYAFRYGNQDAANRMRYRSLRGLSLKRTYGTTVASLEHVGFDYHAVLDCNIQDCFAEGFESGHNLHGGIGVDMGNVYNCYTNLQVTNCRYGIDIADGGASAPNGYTNENNFFGGRMSLGSVITDESPGAGPVPGPYVAPNCIAIRVRYLGAHIPNNNRFYGVSLENLWGRKIYCEGIENYWYACRYENQNGLCDIEFYDTATGGQTGSRNMVFEGDELHDCDIQPPGGNGSNFDGSARTVNLNKIMSNTNWYIRAGSGSTTDAGVQFSTGTETNDAMQIRGAAQAYSIGLQADNTASYAGALTFRDPTTGALLYKLRLRLGSPNQVVLSNASGVDIGAFYLSGNNFVLQDLRGNTADKGVTEVVGGHATDPLVTALRMRNGQVSSGLSGLVATAGAAMRLGFVAEQGGGFLGAILGYSGAAAAEVERNRIHLLSGGTFPWGIQNGLRGNTADAPGGDLEWRDGTGTPANALKVNTTTGRVEVGGHTPGTQDGKLSATSLSLNDFLEISTTSVAVNTALGNATCYLGLTAPGLTITLPPVANVRDGHVVIIKDENTAGGHTIDGNAAETIDGALTQALGALACLTLVKRNGAWWIV